MHTSGGFGRRSGVRDEHAVCDALAVLPDPQTLRHRAAWFAAGMNASTVSQAAMRVLRSAGLVSDRRDGRLIRYRVSDPRSAAFLIEGPGLA